MFEDTIINFGALRLRALEDPAAEKLLLQYCSHHPDWPPSRRCERMTRSGTPCHSYARRFGVPACGSHASFLERLEARRALDAWFGAHPAWADELRQVFIDAESEEPPFP